MMMKSGQLPNADGDAPTKPQALANIGHWLRSQGYAFVTVSPATHAAVLSNRSAAADSLRDVFGWSLPFAADLLPAGIVTALRTANLLETAANGLLRSAVRFSTLGDLLFPHSSFPTHQNESVFFGPDTYRFAALIRRELRSQPLACGSRVLDVGCGTGAGGLVAATCPGPADTEVWLSDISATALEFAQASVVLASTLTGIKPVGLRQADLFSGLDGDFDLIVANPPYLNDGAQRLYRHGGGQWGEALSIRILREGFSRLSPGGRLVLYTGSANVQGVDLLGNALRAELAHGDCDWTYEEIDPDVFGEELQSPAYAGVDRIAAVSLIVRKPSP